MDHTARIARRGVVLTVLAVMQLMASVTLVVVQDGRETFVNRVGFLNINIVQHNLIFDLNVVIFRPQKVLFKLWLFLKSS